MAIRVQLDRIPGPTAGRQKVTENAGVLDRDVLEDEDAHHRATLSEPPEPGNRCQEGLPRIPT